ncbi:MAG TPA: HEAT repeat domain-containing protein [Polyangiaceae bacterium]
MRRNNLLKLAMGCVLAVASTFASGDASSAQPPRQVTPTGGGIAGVYGTQRADQAEFLSTSDAIKSAAVSGSPTLIWETLEHGEKIECLDCIPVVAPLLYSSNAKNREIAAWWLRRRIFGVFGTGEVYDQTVQALQTSSDPLRRSYAAYALGEFLAAPGVAACASAVVSDGDARVRAAAASALGRLNDDGGGALGQALSDSDPTVKLAALASAGRINSFSSVAALSALTNDSTPEVRRRSIEILDALNVADALAPVSAAAQNDADARVRAVACHALGTFGNPSALSILQNLSQNDPDVFVRDQATIAMRRL